MTICIRRNIHLSNIIRKALCAMLLVLSSAVAAVAQDSLRIQPIAHDSLPMRPTAFVFTPEHNTIPTMATLTKADSLKLLAQPDTIRLKKRRDWATWRPNPKRAMWLAIVLPGAGQIYNRKYWKLPLVYGGFVGCAYAMRWNNQMYRDYSQAYMDLMDNDPNTQSYNKFLYLGNQIDNSNKEYYQKLFKNRKDRYRKWRDMSVFAMVGVYLISVVDAYVDASLSEFDISRDLSMKVSPAVIKERSEWTSYNPLNSSAVGLQCSLTF